jgi:hypothetical protein
MEVLVIFMLLSLQRGLFCHSCTVETLKRIASTLVKHYASQDAYELALSKEKSVNASAEMKVPAGTDFTPPSTSIPEEPQLMTEEAATGDGRAG